MEIRQQQLDNGLTIIAECNDSSHFFATGVFVRAGARDETDEIAGVSHFLEHMVFKGTQRRSADEVNLLLDELGSHSNARTSEESTIYHAAVLPEFQSQVVELLVDLMRPALREEDFETERKVIIEEIMMYQDQPPYGGHEQLMREYFGNHPLSHSVLGTAETVGGLSVDAMRNYWGQRYSPGNLAVVAAGRVEFDRLVDELSDWCGYWPNVTTDRPTCEPQPRFGFNELIKPTSAMQYMLQLAPGPSLFDEDRYAMRILTHALGGDGGSRLYWDLVDSGLAESAGIGSYEYGDAGIVMSYFCCVPENTAENLAKLTELQCQAIDGITEQELELAKTKIAAQILMASERTESRMFSLGSQWLNGQRLKTPQEIADSYLKLDLAAVNCAAKKYSLENQYSLSVGPLSLQ